MEVILSWLIVPDFWDQTELILIEKKEIKQSLGLPVKQKNFRPSDLQSQQKLALQLVELKSLKQREEPLDSYFQGLEDLETSLLLYNLVKTGFLLKLEPQKDSEQWISMVEMTKPVEEQFKKMLFVYVRLITEHVSSSLPSPSFVPDTASSSGPAPVKTVSDFKKEVVTFQNLIFQKANLSQKKLQLEVFYNSFKPFQKAWVFYFLFLVALSVLSILKKSSFVKWFSPLALAGFTCHSLGMAFRSYIMSRPPVSNMYETVIWVPWVALIAGFVFYLKGLKLPLTASFLLSAFCLLLTSLAPDILDGSLQPLEAVLNSSFWLTTHVLIITMSYSFFFLAFVLGDMALISYLIKRNQAMDLVNKLYHPIYRSIQWGVVFLAGGTILGGIWADYSWGRFWGWDPKESWALISLLAYLAVLHGRLIGWIKAFGMALSSVLMFFSIIMAWYGVNFVLGAGLHSYGFGTGGVEYVFAFLVLHLILCALALFQFSKLKKR